MNVVDSKSIIDCGGKCTGDPDERVEPVPCTGDLSQKLPEYVPTFDVGEFMQQGA